MSGESAQRAKDVFLEAIDQPIAERAGFVASRCGNDARLLDRVQSLLRAHETTSGFLGGPLPGDGPVDAESCDLLVGCTIGQYRVIRRIASGGMGTVYEAAQERPRRTVAIKLMRGGLPSRSVKRRFEYESQLLAELHHPGIAQVYESGVHIDRDGVIGPAGAPVPFFAMEYIPHARTLTDYAAARQLAVRARLELFCLVCDAVHHGHQHGIIHRDLKPANILVSDELSSACGLETPGHETSKPSPGSDPRMPLPKIIDFGVARWTGAEATLTTLQTSVGQIIGTLAYMSPEQCGGRPAEVDARSDVYSLGVVLYELLLGRLPYDLTDKRIDEATLSIREHPPRRPSTFNRTLRGDLETIILKALEKERERRYSSADALADDIRRFLANRPVSAHPASAMYQFRSFARRNKTLVGAALTVLAVLLAGIVATSWMAMVQARLRRVADLKSDEAQRSERIAQLHAYRAQLTAAAAALRNHDGRAARQHLEQAPESLRGWEWHYFFNRLDQSRLTIPLEAPARGRRDIQADFGPDGGSIDVVSPETGWHGTFDARSGAPLSLSAAPSESQLAHCRRGGLACWTSADGNVHIQRGDGTRLTYELRLLGLAGHRLRGVATPDMKRLLVGEATGWLGTLTVIDTESGRIKTRHMWVDGNCRSFDLSHAGWVASTSDEAGPNPIIWNPDTNETHRLPTETRIAALAFCPSRDPPQRLATGSYNGELHVWDVSGPRVLNTAQAHAGLVSELAFDDSGRWLASTGSDATVRLWDPATLAPRGEFLGHTDFAYGLRFSQDASDVLTVSVDGTVRIWNPHEAESARVLRGHSNFVNPVAVSPDGRLIASAGWDATVRLWDVESGDSVAVIQDCNRRSIVVRFSPDGTRVASLSVDESGDLVHGSSLCVWDTTTGRLITRLANARLSSADFDRKGRSLLHIDVPGGELRLWNHDTQSAEGKPLSALAQMSLPRISPDGRWYAYGCADGMCVVAIADGRTQWAQRWQPSFNGTCAFAPIAGDRTLLAIARGEPDLAQHGQVDVIEVESGREVATLRGHSDSVLDLCWSPDGTRLATAGHDGVICIWDGATFERLAELREHKSYVWSIAWSVDGQRLVSGSGDGTVRIWEADPIAVRLRARHDRAARLPAVETRIAALFEQLGNAESVATAVRADPVLQPDDRWLAHQVVLREATRRRGSR